MSLVRRRAAFAAAAVLVALLGLAAAVGAQDATPVRVSGSAIAAPLVEAVAANSNIEVSLNTTGTTAGLAALCSGEADIALANRPLTADEEAVCAAAGVNFYEVLLGHTAAVVIANNASPAPECLTAEQLALVFAPSAAGTITTWQQVVPSTAADPLTVVVPEGENLVVNLIDQSVDGDGLRADVTTAADDTAVADVVASTPGAIGVVNASTSLPDGVRALTLNTTAAGCTAPTASALEARTYSAGEPLFAYVSSGSADAVTLANALVNSGDQATAQGFVAPSEAAATLNADILAASNTGREFTRYVTEFTIDPALTGSVVAAGSPAGYQLLSTLSSAISTQYQGIVLTNTLLGQSVGLNSLCTGAADIAAVVGQASDEQLASCTSAGIEPTIIPLGGRPVVLVANMSNTSAQCLTPEQVATVFTTPAATWSDVDASFPSTPVMAIGPLGGSSLSDLLARLSAGPDALLRGDVVTNTDPLYRAAAVANVEGGITFMDWNEYQRVQELGQTGVQLVSVDGGNGCVAPSEEAFEAGTYPLWQPLSLYVNPVSLTKPAVQAALWYLLSDENYALLSAADLVGLPFAQLAPTRYQLQDAFTSAAEVVAEATPEATPAS
ncbi:MAG: substrate-binding domain-containing protein [Anaerolineae bacterium]